MFLALTAAATAFQVYGQIQQGKVAAANAQAESKAENYNAAVNTQNAQQSGIVASSRELEQRANNAQQLGNIRAGLAETGGGEAGTNAGVLNQSATNMELDALTTRYQGVLGARAYTAQAGLNTYQSKVAAANVGPARGAGYFGAASSLLRGGAGAYNYYNPSGNLPPASGYG